MEIDGYQWLIILHHKYGLNKYMEAHSIIGTNLMSLNHLQIISKQIIF